MAELTEETVARAVLEDAMTGWVAAVIAHMLATRFEVSPAVMTEIGAQALQTAVLANSGDEAAIASVADAMRPPRTMVRQVLEARAAKAARIN